MIALLAALPPPEEIRRTAMDVLGRPEYAPDPAGDAQRGLVGLLLEGGAWLIDRFNDLTHVLEALPVWLQWVIKVVLSVVLMLIAAHVMYTLAKAVRAPRRGPTTPEEGSRVQRPDVLERQADEAVGRREFIAAVRLLFRASVLRLENLEKRVNRPGATNRELLRRYRATPVFESLQLFVETIDAKWYGEQPCGEVDYSACLDAYRNLTRLAAHATAPAAAEHTLSK